MTRRVVGAIALFGSVQGVSAVCSLIRNKLIALWVGAAGVGLAGILAMAYEMFSALAQLGLRVSIVREIAQSSGLQYFRMRRVVRRISVLLGLGVGLIAVALAPLLSRLSLGDGRATWMFMLIGGGVFLNTLQQCEQAILQGLGKYKRVAAIAFISIPLSLAIIVPLLWYYRLQAMIAVVLTVVVVSTVVAFLLRDRSKAPAEIRRESLSLKETFSSSRQLLSVGFVLTLTGFLTWLVNYFVIAFIANEGGLETSGCYQAGYTLTVNYMGVLLASLSVEYFPRLSSAAAAGYRRQATMMRHQTLTLIAVVGPIALTMSLLAKWAVAVLYSSDFFDAVPMIVAAAPGTVIRVAALSVAYIILANAGKRIYLLTEVSSSLICVVLNVVCYRLWGLMGAGLAFSLWYAIYFLIVVVAVRRTYGIKLGRRTTAVVLSLTALQTLVSTALLIFR